MGRFYSFLERGETHSAAVIVKGRGWKTALQAGQDVNHNEEASGWSALAPSFYRMNKYLLSIYYFLGNLFYTQLNEKLQLSKGSKGEVH